MIYRTKSRIAFEIFNYIVLFSFSISIILPFIHIIAISLSDPHEMLKREIGLIPAGFNFYAYKDVLSSALFLKCFLNSVIVTVSAVTLSIIILLMAAYALSKPYLKGKKFINLFFIFTMYFSGGLIPFYMIVKQLGIRNTYFALIIPYLVSVFYMLLIRTQIENVPDSLVDAACIDGASDFQVLLNVIIPVIKPTIVTIGLYLTVQHWNAWMNVLLFVDHKSLWTLQYKLRDILVSASVIQNQEMTAARTLDQNSLTNMENYKMVSILLTMVPILCIYPFLQKYFTKGILIGAVKG